MAKTYEISFKLGAQMAGNFAKTMASADGALGKLNKTIGAMSKQQGSYDSLIKLRNQVGESARDYARAREEVAKLGRQMSQTENPSKELTKEFEKAQRQVTKTKGRLEQKRQALKELDTTMGTTGQSTKELVRQQARLEQSANRARDAQASLQKTIAAEQKNLEKRGNLRGQMFDAVAIGASVVAFTKGARDISKAQGELATLSVSEKGLGAITKMGMNMSNQWAGVTVPDFIRASYDIRSGIESISETAVGKFTEMSALTAAATKSTTGEMTNLFAKGYGIYRKQFESFGAQVIDGWNNLSAEERDIKFGESFSAGISAAVKQFRTDGSQMSQALSNLGANATAMGHSMEDQIATLGALQKTMSGSESATKYRAFLRGATKAQDKLNLSFTDSNGRLKGTSDILTEIQRKYGSNLSAENVAEISQAFGGDEAGSFINALISDIDGLNKGAEAIEANMKRGAEATKEMAKAGQRGQEFELMAQRMQNASSAISKGLLPAILPATESLGNMAMWVGEVAQKYPTLTKYIGGAIVVLAALKVAAIAGGFAWTFIYGAGLKVVKMMKVMRVAYLLHTGALTANTAASKGAIIVSKLFTAVQWAQNIAVGAAKWGWATAKMLAFKTAQIAVSAATKTMTAAQWLFNAAMMANPIGLVIAAIAALVAAGIWMYKNWSKVTAFFTGAWEKFKNLFLMFTPVGWMMSGMKPLFGWISGNWGKVSNFFSGSWDRIKKLFVMFSPLHWMMKGFNALTGWLSKFSLFNSGKKMLSTLASGIRSAVTAPVRAIKGALSKVRQYLPFSDAKVGPLSELTASGSAIMETLGKGMNKDGASSMMSSFSASAVDMLNKMRTNPVLGSLMDSLNGFNPMSMVQSLGNSSESGAGGGSPIYLTVEQNINLDGGSGDVEQQARRGASQGAQDMLKELEKAMGREKRLSYA